MQILQGQGSYETQIWNMGDRLELMVIFENSDGESYPIRYKELQNIVAKIETEVAEKGMVFPKAQKELN